MKKIILVGYMGAGKSIIGKNLSEKLNLPFYDLDDLIENEELKSVKEIFDEKGEIYFRKKENQILLSTLEKEYAFILSFGGGTPCYYENHLILQDQKYCSIYLKASISTLSNRLMVNKNERPLIANFDNDALTEFIAKHLFERSYYYNQCQNIVEVDGKSPEEIVAQIINLN